MTVFDVTIVLLFFFTPCTLDIFFFFVYTDSKIRSVKYMHGFKIQFDGLPKTLWACETQIENYNWSSGRHNEQTLEIGIIKAEKHTIVIDGKQHVIKDVPVLCCIAGNDGSSGYAEPDISVEVTTIAVQWPELVIHAGEITDKDYDDKSIFILPRYLDDCPEEYITEISFLLHSFVRANTKDYAADHATCLSILFQLLAKIDSHVRKRFFGTNQKSYYYYVKKINSIVNKRYATKLTQHDVAKELGISVSYLSSMYKQAPGQTFSEYLLQTRMNHAAELLLSSNLSTAQLATAVGFEAESHFRRRFKQYFGMNVREYRYIQKGMTLYHPKPTRQLMKGEID